VSQRLSRAVVQEQSPSIRIVHLGLGAFARSHQAWYTAHASDAADWGIAAFTGRSPAAAGPLAEQDGLFTLLTRSADGDTAEIVGSIVEANDGANVARLVELLAKPATAIVTLTLTEAGYRLTGDGEPDRTDPALAEDLALLAGMRTASSAATPTATTAATPASTTTASKVGSLAPQTPLARLALGLVARYHAGGAPITIVPCDNVPGVGAWLRRGVTAIVRTADPDAAHWLEASVSFVSTSVDRITPATTPADHAVAARLTGFDDRSPVVTEPFTDWILQGDFPAGRPRWEDAGARFVADVAPFERRKLWLLNGGHSLLAYRGIESGHSTVFEAWADETLRDEVEQLWAEAREVLDLPAAELDKWLDAVRERWRNPRIEHLLAQIAAGGEQKIPARILAVAEARANAGLPVGQAGQSVIAAWNRFRTTGGVA
jgi:fructuronate reductase